MLGRILCSSFFCFHDRLHSSARGQRHVASVELCSRSHYALNAFRAVVRHGEWELEILRAALRLSSFHWTCHPPVADDPHRVWRHVVYHAGLRYASKKEEMVPVWCGEGPPQRPGNLVQCLRQSQRATASHPKPIWSVSFSIPS
jgi:hypothetical protein